MTEQGPRCRRDRGRLTVWIVIDDVRLIISKSLKIPAEQLTADARLDELGCRVARRDRDYHLSLEEKFNISIPLEADEGTPPRRPSASGGNAEMQFSTVGDIADIVKKLVEAKPSR